VKIIKILILILCIHILSGFASAEQIPILMYHNILEGKGMRRAAKDLACPPQQFWAHLLYIQQAGYRTVTFKDMKDNRYPKAKKIIITFDDGLISQWDAFDELQKRNMVAVFFPVLRSIGNRKYLNEGQLRVMARMGMEIGSHSMTHPFLVRSSEKKVEFEIRESKVQLERITGIEVITFCYPYGRYSNKIIKVVESAGYYYARTTNEAIADFSYAKNFELPVIYIHNNTDVNKLKYLLGNK
jgi:peptidoglycan/xylan/chitin deacetylase (PgdA/CDA1 family)